MMLDGGHPKAAVPKQKAPSRLGRTLDMRHGGGGHGDSGQQCFSGGKNTCPDEDPEGSVGAAAPRPTPASTGLTLRPNREPTQP